MARGSTGFTKAADAYSAARSHPYVQRLIEDEELRDNLRDAYGAARHAYDRIAKNGKPAQRLMDDRKVQKDLRSAADSLREASDQLRGRRKAVMDALFGAEEEFEYTSTTSAGNGAGS